MDNSGRVRRSWFAYEDVAPALAPPDELLEDDPEVDVDEDDEEGAAGLAASEDDDELLEAESPDDELDVSDFASAELFGLSALPAPARESLR